MKKLLPFLIVVIAGCQKTVHDPGPHTLTVSRSGPIKINQELTFADSTQGVLDSVYGIYSHPGYEWIVTPEDSCTTIIQSEWGSQVNIIFHCAGTYKVTARIYDKLTHITLHQCDTIEIHVSSDTLYRTQQILADDTLRVYARKWGSANEINFFTTKEYSPQNTMLKFQNTRPTDNGYTFIISDTIILITYPFVYGNGTKGPAGASVLIPTPDLNSPVPISITWLGKTYQGTITRTNDTTFTSSWNNSGAVKLFTD